MKIGFVVGYIEQHHMELSYDQRSGDLNLLMDGTQVLEDRSALHRERTRRYEVHIGEAEKHILALQLAYSDDPEGPATPRLSLAVTPLADQGIVHGSLALHGADNVFAARAAAASGVS